MSWLAAFQWSTAWLILRPCLTGGRRGSRSSLPSCLSENNRKEKDVVPGRLEQQRAETSCPEFSFFFSSYVAYGSCVSTLCIHLDSDTPSSGMCARSR